MRPFFYPLLVIAGLWLGAGPAAGQSARPERPNRALFGGGFGASEQVLTAHFTLGSGYLDNAVADWDTVADWGLGPEAFLLTNVPLPRIGAGYGFASGSLSYRLSGRRLGVSAGVTSGGSYYPRISRELVMSHSGEVGVSWQAGRHRYVSARQRIGYQPYTYQSAFAGLVSGAPGLLDLDLALGASRDIYTSYDTEIGVSQQVSRRTTASATYSYHLSRMPVLRSDDLSTHRAGGQVSVDVSRGLGVRLGYGYTHGRYAFGSVRGHTIDAGVDYSRPLAFSRRTVASLSTGTTAISTLNHTRYSLVGRAQISHALARTWTTAAAYERSVAFVALLQQPWFYDAVTLSLSGLLTPRLPVHASAGMMVGDVGLGRVIEARRLRSYQASAGTSLAVTRYAGVGVGYSYSLYDAGPGIPIAPGLPDLLGRHGVRAFVTLSAPLVHRARRPDAAR